MSFKNFLNEKTEVFLQDLEVSTQKNSKFRVLNKSMKLIKELEPK